MENRFKKHRRTKIAELRPVTEEDLKQYEVEGGIMYLGDTARYAVSISDVDRRNGSPRIGDMIARNPENHNDQWLVAEKYYKDNFEEI